MKKLITILLLCFASFGYSQVYTPVIANYTISGKPIGYSQATPSDGRSMFYDASNFIYRPYRDSQEVITYLNLAKYRAGNAIYFVDSGGTLNGNGTYTNLHVTYWTFQDGVADVNLIKLNLNGNSSGGGGCPSCYFTATQLTDSSYTLNRPNLTKDTFVFDLNSSINIQTLDNGLTLTGTNGRLGGPLVVNTVINGGARSLAISGNSFQEGEGATISTAAVLTPGLDGNTFQVIGSSAINDISITNIQGGTHVGFIFTGTPTLSNNVSGPAGSAPMLLAGSVNYTAATGDYIEFVYDAINVAWHETARKLSGSGGVYTFSSGLTELPATQVKLGGSLTQPTTIAGNGFPTFFSGGRVEPGMGIPILAAGDLVTGNDGILFHVTGTTQINAINNQNWQAGSEIGFIFDNIVTLKNNTAGGINTAPMLLAGRVDYTSAVGDYIGFKYDGVNFYETERKLAGSTTSGISTANNGLTVNPAGNVQLGGTLIQNTSVATGTFQLTIGSNSNAPLIVQTSNSSNNNIVPVMTISRTGGTTPAGLYGEEVDFSLLNSTLTARNAASLSTAWNVATSGSEDAFVRLAGYTGGTGTTSWMDVSGNSITGYGKTYGFITTNASTNGILSSGAITGVQSTGTVTGVFAGSASVPLWVSNSATTNSTIEQGILIQRVGSTAPTSGEGSKIQFDLKNDAVSTITSGNIIHKLTTVTAGSEISEFDFQVNNGTGIGTRFIISGPATLAFGTRFELARGASVASTGNLTLGTDGNVFHITGTTQINAITTANWQNGSEIILIFDASLTVKNNTAGGAGTAVMLLAGGADFSATSNDVLTLIWDGTSFFEKCRSVN